jgi:hypothetical protein
MQMTLDYDTPSIGEQPMALSELLDKGPTPASEYDWSGWTGFPSHAVLQLPRNLCVAAGAFLAHQKHKTSHSYTHPPRTWPLSFINVISELGVSKDIVASHKVQAYIAEKCVALFDVVSVRYLLIIPFSLFIGTCGFRVLS